MNMLKKNQIIIYTFALMLVAAGYLNYTSKMNETDVQTSAPNMEIADIGDATLVSSNDLLSENSTNSIQTNNNDQNSNSIEQNNNMINNPTSESTTNNSNSINTESQFIEASSNVDNNEYFVKSKLERETMYSQMIESYEKILNSSNSLETRETISYTRN